MRDLMFVIFINYQVSSTNIIYDRRKFHKIGLVGSEGCDQKKIAKCL